MAASIVGGQWAHPENPIEVETAVQTAYDILEEIDGDEEKRTETAFDYAMKQAEEHRARRDARAKKEAEAKAEADAVRLHKAPATPAP